eukprot:CAMPEP_0201106562 /NCGR_PEP_ID=MMETSP0812-20130820/52248_1 /ASSEMBLY_ACC=CAM_ASM_000668 /TAXON_ID=98059 /ORGANISM="Dinobryon sp., Strain UTEXLB2267" /LENGTH=70 /DNA_ID=CAMNT_0047366979 /DNA_START=107 /DNA_END=316 /DNA_ORIENTATION=+
MQEVSCRSSPSKALLISRADLSVAKGPAAATAAPLLTAEAAGAPLALPTTSCRDLCLPTVVRSKESGSSD